MFGAGRKRRSRDSSSTSRSLNAGARDVIFESLPGSENCTAFGAPIQHDSALAGTVNNASRSGSVLVSGA
jgi:hypothetical protein